MPRNERAQDAFPNIECFYSIKFLRITLF